MSNRRMPAIVVMVALFAMAVLAGGCSGSGGGTGYTAPSGGTTGAGTTSGTATGAAGGTTAPATGTDVTIQGFAFSPTNLQVKVGDTVTWTNKDPAPHQVAADDGSFKSDPLNQGATFKHTFTKAGAVNYHCAIHTYMTATITVK